MIPTVSDADTERFRSLVARHLGFRFEDAKLPFLADLLRRRLDERRCSAASYLSTLDTEIVDDQEMGALSLELTVPETYFFRNNDQYRAFVEVVLPDRKSTQAPTRRLRILSAGCASGEEAYSLAILVREALDPSWHTSILGVDINPAVLRKAVQARYSIWALRETAPDVRERWFRPDGRDFVLDERVRTTVTFEAGNLVKNDAAAWMPDAYDVVFFRNVLMYFTLEQQKAVIDRLTRALKPGGYLFLGHAENLRGLSTDFHLCHTHGTFYYQRKDRKEQATFAMPFSAGSRGDISAGVAVLEGADTWIDAIRKASERIEALSGASRDSAPRESAFHPAAAPAAWSLDPAVELLREERFAEALEMVHRLPPETDQDPDVLLLKAALHTLRGRLTDAEQACRRLLDVDDLSAGAHYLLALCREGAGDRHLAVHHDQMAIHLDATFAMPHLHLGLLARREGDRGAAQHELAQALGLLEREDSSRLLLFGGGFGRNTLLALCRTELASCGGPASRLM